jgi:hypothetical protein
MSKVSFEGHVFVIVLDVILQSLLVFSQSQSLIPQELDLDQ